MSAPEAAPKAKSRNPFGFFSWVIGCGLLWWFVLAPASNHFVMTGETGAGGYAVIADAYPTLKPATQAKIKARYAKGYLTRTDVVDLTDAIVDEKGMVQTYPAPDFGDPKEAFQGDVGLWNRITGERSSYKSKAALERLLGVTPAAH